jgi:hypothetical protein
MEEKKQTLHLIASTNKKKFGWENKKDGNSPAWENNQTFYNWIVY